jgi:prolyl-tRNA synthetase
LLAINKSADKIYNQLKKAGVDVLYDDRDVSAGEKFADADLLGITWRAVVSEKTGAKIELKKRDSKNAELVPLKQLLAL